jgi:hypothetical protein
VFVSGDRYTGEFSRGLFHGQGTYAWKNGNRYEGAWVLGKKHGLGRFFWASGEGWEGEFRDDLKTEAGKDIAAAHADSSPSHTHCRRRSISFQISGVRISCMARSSLPPGTTMVLARLMKLSWIMRSR